MIKLICPKCESDKIFYSDKEDAKEDHFKCDECGKEFTRQESEWETE